MCQNIEYTIQNIWYDEDDGNDDSILDERFTGPIDWPPGWKEEITSVLNLSQNQASFTTGENRCEGGNPCPRTGYWHVWHEAGSRRHFKEGDIMPGGLSTQGERVWYWDEDQSAKPA
jgi:hypothetical protein